MKKSLPDTPKSECSTIELDGAQRKCSKCSERLPLTLEQCTACQYTDPSLGIVDVITSGDALQAWRLLEVKRPLVHTRTSGHEWTLLHMASARGNIQLVNLLLEAGADINAQNIHGKTALHYAASKGRDRIVGLLLDHQADPALCFENKTPLELAMECGHGATADILRERAVPEEE